jgi:hypothetical protein
MRHFQGMVRKNGSLVNSRSIAYVDGVQRFWERHYGRRIDPAWHLACANVTGIEDVRYIPQGVWWDDVLLRFNQQSMLEAYDDKNLYHLLLPDTSGPETVLKRINGRYYDGDSRWISRGAALDRLVSDGKPKIIKPSRTNNGERIQRIDIAEGGVRIGGGATDLAGLEARYGGNFLVQAMIVQHPAMAEVHPDSVNTLRLLTFRWGDTIQCLMAFARFGNQGRINDNAGTGGLCCGIDEHGQMNAVAIDHNGRSYATHPSTGYSFSRRSHVPSFGEVRARVLTLHEQIPHFDLVSWDMTVGPDGQPIFVEANFRGAIYVYQFACRRSVFGELTVDVLRTLRRRRELPARRRRDGS